MNSLDLIQHSKLLMNNENWDPDHSILITLSYTPGSCSLTGYKITPGGYDWAKVNKDNIQATQGT